MKTVVISAVNFTEGGPLTILRDAIESAVNHFDESWKIFAIVSRPGLVSSQRAEYRYFPNAKKSWFVRLYYEWVRFKRLSEELRPDLWVSLHDITPHVVAKRQIVYCHNPSLFYKLSLVEALFEPTLLVFHYLYSFIYRINIKKNTHVIVQQEWICKEFKKRFGISNVIVAHPNVPVISASTGRKVEEPNVFFYPALPRVFKNFETICRAVQILRRRGYSKFEVLLTIDGTENRYAKTILRKYCHCEEIKLIGRQIAEQMAIHYQRCSTLVFPSKLETWGLPISEAIMYGKRLIVSDLPYAHESVGAYPNVSFFPPNDSVALADLMESVLSGKWVPAKGRKATTKLPYCNSWSELWSLVSVGL